jgi:hypothetical protein
MSFISEKLTIDSVQEAPEVAVSNFALARPPRVCFKQRNPLLPLKHLHFLLAPQSFPGPYMSRAQSEFLEQGVPV